MTIKDKLQRHKDCEKEKKFAYERKEFDQAKAEQCTSQPHNGGGFNPHSRESNYAKLIDIKDEIKACEQEFKALEDEQLDIECIINSLTGRHKEVLWHRYIKNLTIEDTAEKMECCEMTVKRLSKEAIDVLECSGIK